MTESLISVIVPVYNVEEYLNECISSIVNQTYKNLEIILVDDGSTDKCPYICDDWKNKDDRIVVIHKKNGGLSDARNKGLDVAKGEYVSFIDSDDWISNDFYQVLFNALYEKNAQISASEVIWVYDNYQNKEEFQYNNIVFSPEEALQTLLKGRGFYAVAWNKLYKKALFDGIKFPIGKLHEDEFVTYKLIHKADKLVLCKNTNYYYRQRQGSIMKEWSSKHLDVLEAYFERNNFLKLNYPNLYLHDKVFLLCACVNLYKECKLNKVPTGQNIVVNYSRLIHFSCKELIFLNLKSFIRVIRGKMFFYMNSSGERYE